VSLGFRVGVPGMKVRVSTRGVRASVGPRIARVHVGSGRTRVSSGLGPLFASTALSSGRSRSTRGATRRAGPTVGQLVARQRAAERAQDEAEKFRTNAALAAELAALVNVHRDSWPVAVRPVVVAPALPYLEQVRQEVRALAVAGVGAFARQQRQEARTRADADAEQYLRDEAARLMRVRDELQVQADQWWAELQGNDETVVCEALNAAFSDNPAGGVALGVEAGTCSVLIRQADLEDLPTQRPDLTPTGRPTLKKLAQRDRHRLFLRSLVSNVAATLLEGFACAPGLDAITVCAVARDDRTQRLGVVIAGRWTRQAVLATSWGADDDARELVLDRASELHVDVAVNGAVRLLDPKHVPVVAAVLALAEPDGAGQPDPMPPASPVSPLVVRPFLQWAAERAAVPAQAPPRAPAPTPAAGHGRRLSPGQVVTLTEGETVMPLVVTARSARGFEVDLSVLLLGEDGRVRTDADLVFYNAPVSRTGAVRVDLPEDQGAIRVSRAVVDARELPGEGVLRVAVVVSAGEVPLARVDGLELLVWVSGAPPIQVPLPTEPGVPAAAVCEIYRRTTGAVEQWRVRGTGQGWVDGLAGLARSYGVAVD
jgi:stress response protein SCP2